MAAVVQNIANVAPKPELVFRLDGFGCDVNDAICIPGGEAVVTGSEDRSLRVWMRRDMSRFWPSAMEILPSPVCCLSYTEGCIIHAGLENGTVVEFTLANDLNSLEHKRDYLSHTARVNQIMVCRERNWIFSVSKDNRLAWCSMANGKQCFSVQLDAVGTAIEFDSELLLGFVGDASGRIKMFRLRADSGVVDENSIRDLVRHDQPITSLYWDSEHSRLFSSSADHSVILWDLTENKQQPLKLECHQKECTSICWWPDGNVKNLMGVQTDGTKYNGMLISGGLDGLLIFWFMHPNRASAPNWFDSDTCQLCLAPFFWNVKKMWNVMSVGVRQHHCRRCGKAVCEKCSSFHFPLPYLGFERNVRICRDCAPSIGDADRQGMAITFDARHPITRVRLDVTQKLLLTVGKDRIIKVWKLPDFSSR